MANEWFYTQDDRQQEPVSFERLKELAESGQLQASDLVWKEGMADWLPAGQVQGLLPARKPTPPPIPSKPKAPPPPGRPAQPPAPVAVGDFGAPAAAFSPRQKLRRILLIVAAGAIVLCFFLPQFYVSAGEGPRSRSSLCFGWNLWFGIVAFIIGLLALGGVIVEIVLQRIALVREIAKWVYLGTFSVIALCSFLGTLLGLFGIGVKVFVRPLGWVPPSEVPGNVTSSSVCVPITSLLVIGGAVLGLVVALAILRGDKE